MTNPKLISQSEPINCISDSSVFNKQPVNELLLYFCYHLEISPEGSTPPLTAAQVKYSIRFGKPRFRKG